MGWHIRVACNRRVAENIRVQMGLRLTFDRSFQVLNVVCIDLDLEDRAVQDAWIVHRPPLIVWHNVIIGESIPLLRSV